MSVVRPPAVVFLAGIAGLFLEMALVRWVSCEIRVFAYCKNLVLVACFLGFGTGCMMSRRRPAWVAAFLAPLVLALLVTLPWRVLVLYGPGRVTSVLGELEGFMIFQHARAALPWGAAGRWIFAVGWTTVLFFLVALLMLPFGQATARGIAAMDRPLAGYSWNVAGSLLGILGFAAVTRLELSPAWWFLPPALAAAALAEGRFRKYAVVGSTAAAALFLIPDRGFERREIWSSYQKLTLVEERFVLVNNTGYQVMARQQPFAGDTPARVDRWNLPYVLHRPVGRVLIVGAGTGNDAAAALEAGASEVTAVEIDPTIFRIGREFHPQRPYSDPRVRVVLNDARRFLQTTGGRFDVIVFSHLDAHTVLSGHTNVRLDNYIYTVEAFREARRRLAPRGLVYVSYFSELPFMGQRLARNIAEAFGRAPIAREGKVTDWFREIYFFLPAREDEEAVRATLGGSKFLRPAAYDPASIVPSTDAWPFLHLDRPRIPPIMLAISGAILFLAAGFAMLARPRGEPFDGRLFFLGAAFMLLEAHNVSRLALVFGTTWTVNAWVISVVLGLILAANALCLLLGPRPALSRFAAAALFLSLAAAWGIPLEPLRAAGSPLGGLAATFLLCLPIFFAGIVFADAFRESRAPCFGLGWNVLGTVVGGMAESLSYAWGIPALVALAAAFYAAALAFPRPRPV